MDFDYTKFRTKKLYFMQKYKIIFIGLGTMGFNMATFLAKSKKYDLHIYNRTKNIFTKMVKKKFS